MREEESKWIKNVLEKIRIPEGSVILNIGSGYELDNKKPYIQTNVLGPLVIRKYTVINVDIVDKKGVDLVGDLLSQEFVTQLQQLTPKMIICCNVLEHIPSKLLPRFRSSLINILGQSTYLLISVPYNYPYHRDPIDNLLRPNLLKLKNDFNSLAFVDGVELECGSFREDYLSYSLFNKFLYWGRLLVPFYKPLSWLGRMDRLRWFFKKYVISIALFQK